MKIFISAFFCIFARIIIVLSLMALTSNTAYFKDNYHREKVVLITLTKLYEQTLL